MLLKCFVYISPK